MSGEIITEIKTPEAWTRRLRLLMQEEAEAAHSVAMWALELHGSPAAVLPLGAHFALRRFRIARDEFRKFLSEVNFP